MATYEIIYDYSYSEEYDGEFFCVDEKNCVEYFTGTHTELLDHLNEMKEDGRCYNISATAVENDGERW